MSKPKFIVITPAKNEENYLGKTIESFVSQSVLPSVWVIVDDGSSDNTANIAARAARNHPWIKVVRRENAGSRSMGHKVVAAFNHGFTQVAKQDYEFLFKIDADIVLTPHFFAAMLAKFAENPQLGIASGDVSGTQHHRMTEIKCLPHGFTGAVKCWRRKCFEEIGGLARGLGWDSLDCHEAMRRGWQAVTFTEPEFRVTHLRPEGLSVKNRFWYWFTRGKGLHFVGAHPIWVLASALYHMLDRPIILGGMCLIIGYTAAVLDKSQRYGDGEFRRYLRNWQLKQLAALLRLG